MRLKLVLYFVWIQQSRVDPLIYILPFCGFLFSVTAFTKLPLKNLLSGLAYWAGLVGNGPAISILSPCLDLFMKKLIRDRPIIFLGQALPTSFCWVQVVQHSHNIFDLPISGLQSLIQKYRGPSKENQVLDYNYENYLNKKLCYTQRYNNHKVSTLSRFESIEKGGPISLII